MKIINRKIGSVSLIAPQFPLVDGDNLNNLKQEISNSLQNGETKVVIDCSKVSYMDSRGLECLLDFFDEAKEKAGGVKLCKVNSLCSDILLCTRMSTLFEIFKESEDAVRSFL
jgi:anti-sigma B factor antagonist